MNKIIQIALGIFIGFLLIKWFNSYDMQERTKSIIELFNDYWKL